MKEKVYVDRLFIDYEDSPEIRDFKEEIAGNLKERVKELLSKGSSEELAFEKATAELGDITAIADEVGKKKRSETIGQLYMGARVPLTKRTAAGMAAATGFLLLSVGTALIAFFGEASNAWPYYAAAALLSVASGLYAYFGLTHESAGRHPMARGRAAAYGAVCVAGFLGAGLAVASFLVGGFDISAALGIKLALLLPAICALIFLAATEKDRKKPWLKAIVARDIERTMQFHSDIVDPAKAARFGVVSGGLWIFAVAVFATLRFAVGWDMAWLAFIFALAVQVFLVSTIFDIKGREEKGR